MRVLKSMRSGITACVALLTWSTMLVGTADAYVGPGSGLAALGTVLALVGTVLLGIFGFVWFPIKRMLRRKSKGDAADVKLPAAE